MLDVLFGISPIFAGVVMGLIRPASILVGMHHAMTPIALENFATKGYDMLMPMMPSGWCCGSWATALS